MGTRLTAIPVDEDAQRGYDHIGPTRQQFVAAAGRQADQLAGELVDTGAAVVVCDDFGVVLHLAGQPDVLSAVESVNLVRGSVWSERTAGTNAIGLALELGGTAHVQGAEHYLEALHDFSCTAAVVRHPVTGEPLGVLALAIEAGGPGRFAQPLIVRAAREVARAMEEQLFGRERELLERYLASRAGRALPLLAVDRTGQTMIQNARMLQGASNEDVELLLSVARHALGAEADLVEQLELSRGRTHADIRLVRGENELRGALVSLERADRLGSEPEVSSGRDWAPLIGRSPAMQRLFREAARVAEHRMTVAIHGEPGTGKLSLAETLHRIGGQGSLTIVHCARDDWLNEWGAAVRTGGTIVLRRVHGLGPEVALELCDRLDELEAAGSECWVLSLLNSEVAPPSSELLSRLARMSLFVPALRDRGHDLRLLVDAWCDERERLSSSRPMLRPEVYEALAAQPWPGNVRELRNALDAAALRAGTVIGVESLHLEGRVTPAPASGSLRQIERDAINAALERTGGNVSHAARELGIGRATLHRRLRTYRLLRTSPEVEPD
ncbi:MAG: sigma 54-interacting transcriptional regulator [Solirubrobacterales bacterium]|nr:sigma 54-interacting transcriptional regulator [Solirubrobacterales bacterium]